MRHVANLDGTEKFSKAVKCPRTGLYLSRAPLQDNLLTRSWKDLASRALVANIFYEAEYAIPAAIPFGDGVELIIATEEASPFSRLVGLWPVRISRRRWGVPIPVLVGWTHPFTALGTPLLDRDDAERTLCALMTSSGLIPGVPSRILLPNIPEDGAFSQLLGALAQRYGLRSHAFNLHTRVKLGSDVRENFFEQKLSSRTRSKLRQEFRRIQSHGQVEFETISEPGAIAGAIEDYIALEGRGWKGRAGTAISCAPAESEFLRRAAASLAAERRIRIQRMKLDGKTLASSITYLSESMAWYAKISFDESQAKNSPGSHLVMYATEELLRDGSVTWTDSCAPPDHPLMRKFWSEEISIANRLIDGLGTDRLFEPAARLEGLRLKLSEKWNAHKEKRRARVRSR
jgi:hypothetical protein